MSRLLVVGGASLDVLHLADRTVSSAGGAGLYTAMAARRCGVQVTMFGPRPEPCPPALRPVSDLLSGWLGPAVSQEETARFEIDYRAGQTHYRQASLVAESRLDPNMLPADLSGYDLIHLTPLGDARQQLAFLQACRQRGAKRISGGCGLFIAQEKPRVVADVIALSDIFFMNEQEATAVFGSLESAVSRPGQLLYVTQGDQGARVIQGRSCSLIPAAQAAELDPTGAGDTFCGATLAFLLQKKHPVMAGLQAAALAAEMIGQVGPAALLSPDPPPEAALDPRVRLSPGRLADVAQAISGIAEAAPYPFVAPQLPAVDHPQAVDYFFAATLQQFSFWTIRNERYDRPLIARLDSLELKGSDYLWLAYTRRLLIEPDFCAPQRQSELTLDKMRDLFRADDGRVAMPALELHLDQARQYGQEMLDLELTPQVVVERALSSEQPLQSFIDILDQVAGYKEDPLRKKSSLLAMILNQRPESFLPLPPEEEIAPVIDYHAMRSCLRVGLVEVVDADLRRKLAGRQILTPQEEWAVRYASYRAIEKVTALSGKSTGAVDDFFFNGRKRCPEMSEPDCARCQLDPVCAHYKELFQPVLRTPFY